MTGTVKQTTIAAALNAALHEAMAQDDSVILLGEDIGDDQGGGVFKVTNGLSTKYGTGRVRTTPISEQAIIGSAIGAAIAGLRPVAEIMLMNFVTVAMDQIVNHAAKLRFMSGGQTHVPITIRTTTGAGVGFAGQHSDMLETWFAHVPGLKIVMASNPADAKGLLASAIADDDPVIFIENIMCYAQSGPPLAAGETVPLGKASIVRDGSDVTLITYGRDVGNCIAASQTLDEQGVSAQVIDLRTIAPFDAETLLSAVAKTRRAVVVHEAVKAFGTGAEISSRIHEELFDSLHAPVQRVASSYSPVPFSSPLEQAYLYSQDDILAACQRVLDKGKVA